MRREEGGLRAGVLLSRWAVVRIQRTWRERLARRKRHPAAGPALAAEGRSEDGAPDNGSSDASSCTSVSETYSFLDEVEEEHKRDRAFDEVSMEVGPPSHRSDTVGTPNADSAHGWTGASPAGPHRPHTTVCLGFSGSQRVAMERGGGRKDEEPLTLQAARCEDGGHRPDILMEENWPPPDEPEKAEADAGAEEKSTLDKLCRRRFECLPWGWVEHPPCDCVELSYYPKPSQHAVRCACTKCGAIQGTCRKWVEPSVKYCEACHHLKGEAYRALDGRDWAEPQEPEEEAREPEEERRGVQTCMMEPHGPAKHIWDALRPALGSQQFAGNPFSTPRTDLTAYRNVDHYRCVPTTFRDSLRRDNRQREHERERADEEDLCATLRRWGLRLTQGRR